MANLLNHYRQDYVGKKDYLELLRIYARSQRLKLPGGRVIPFIDEDLNPDTGEWIARSLLYKFPEAKQAEKGGKDRGRDYNHSTYNDLIITGLVGLRPRMDQIVEVSPLVPEGALDYFALDGVRYHDWNLTILWDRTGKGYGRGAGLRLLADGKEIGSAPGLTLLLAKLPEANAGWRKSEHNPLIGGGGLGTVFDIAVLHEDGKYRMWYTGQARGHSWIGYATSADGKTWKRMSDKPVLSPELPWEKVALMCPTVIWDESAGLFRMWYSGGEQYEPDAIGYATSPDGLHWTKHPSNPVFRPDQSHVWEQFKVAGAQVFRSGGWHYIFYIGFRDVDHAQIGIARSRDGITSWERHPGNPVVRPGQDEFDQDACYKPFTLFDGKRWLLWYNGRHGWLERIAMAVHDGEDLGFGK
jgi:hypothetical protein